MADDMVASLRVTYMRRRAYIDELSKLCQRLSREKFTLTLRV